MGLLLTEAIPETYLQILLECLATVDPERTTNPAFQQQLERTLRAKNTGVLDLPTPLIVAPKDNRRLLSNQSMTELVQEIQAVEQAPLRVIAEFLQATVDKRYERGDLWPDGRLQLGITYALLEEYARARDVLEEVIRICESAGKFNNTMAMAA